MANKVKLGFIIAALILFILPLKNNCVYADFEWLPKLKGTLFTPTSTPTPSPTNTPTPTPTLTPTPEPEATPTEELEPTVTAVEEVLPAEEESTPTPTEETKEEGSPTNIWQMATFGLIIAFLAIIIGFLLGGKNQRGSRKSKPQNKEEEPEE